MTISIADEARKILEFSRERDEWNEYPMLFVYNEVNGEVHRIIVALVGGHPIEMLQRFSQAAFSSDEDSTELLAGSLIGLVLFTEGWALVSDPKEPAAALALQEFIASGRPYSEHPDAIEQKSTQGWDGQTMSSFSYARGADSITDFDGEVQGLVPDALRLTYDGLLLARKTR
jgi:hypothetical protein